MNNGTVVSLAYVSRISPKPNSTPRPDSVRNDLLGYNGLLGMGVFSVDAAPVFSPTEEVHDS